MKDYLKNLSPELKEVICRCVQLAQELRMPAYLVGGCLRDLILGVKNCDLDITVQGDGILFAQKLAERLDAEFIVHERFRTATLNLAGGLKLDIATMRREKYPHPGALPVVSPGTLAQDLGRRDFTINAMALNLTAAKGLAIIDPFGGRADLASGRIRILHDLSFKDDPTRILRAVRFSQRFGFKIEPNTLRLLKAAVSGGLLDKVNPHRLRDELILALGEREPFKPIKQLGNLGALSFISAKLKISFATRSLFKSAAGEIAWFSRNFPARRRLDSWLIYFAALLGQFTLSEIRIIIRQLSLSRGQEKRVLDYYRGRKKIISTLSKANPGAPRIFSLLEPLSYETIILLSAFSRNKHFKKHLVDFFRTYHGMRLCICGKDLQELGVLPGPQYQKIFARVLSAKLKGKASDRQAEMAMIQSIVKNKKRNGEQ